MALASVLIPTHDHWATLPLAVNSALGQTVEDVEVIIIGDGVTEQVAEQPVDRALISQSVSSLEDRLQEVIGLFEFIPEQ